MNPSVEKVNVSVVSSQTNITIPIILSEAQELRYALKTIERYNKIGLKHFKIKNKYDVKKSDWYTIEYCVKNDKLIISIVDGMAG